MDTKTPMIVLSIKEFSKANGFTQIAPSVRTNVNGYPFITFSNENNDSDNIYFSKNASKAVGAGEIITRELLSHYQIANTINANGESRTKLVSKLERLDLLSMLD